MALNRKILDKIAEHTKNDKNMHEFLIEIIRCTESGKQYTKPYEALIDKYHKGDLE